MVPKKLAISDRKWIAATLDCEGTRSLDVGRAARRSAPARHPGALAHGERILALLKAAEIVPSAALIDDLGADSIDFVELLLELEERLEIEIDDDTAAQLTTVADVVAYMDKLKARA